MIYLASPYSHPEESIRIQRYDLAVAALVEFIKIGKLVYSPIAQCHICVTRHNLPAGSAYWERYNNNFIERSDAVYVLCIDGWAESKGIRGEVAWAMLRGVPIEFYTFCDNKLESMGSLRVLML